MKMNRIMALLLIIVMVFALAACGKKNETKESKADDPKQSDVDTPESSKDPVEEPDDKTIVLGKTIHFDDFEITVTELKIVDTWDETQCLRITYDWKNTSDKEMTPAFSFIFKAFQNDVEVDNLTISDDVDLGPGQKSVKPGGSITGAHDSVGIEDINAPLLLELSELLSFDDVVYSLEISDLAEYK